MNSYLIFKIDGQLLKNPRYIKVIKAGTFIGVAFPQQTETSKTVLFMFLESHLRRIQLDFYRHQVHSQQTSPLLLGDGAVIELGGQY